jgi:eukaryotic-like serine/threonine-protein kinase
MSLGPGTRLGPYEILSSLGAGGMGEVYRARDPRLSRDVAIKILAARISSSPDALRRFEREARASAALNHPNILAVYDFGAEGAAQYVVSELLIGQTLREALSDGPLPASKTLTYAAQAARGLAAAHDEGIVHRDLKPENLFITRDGRVKILDFGLAKLVDTAPGSLEADIGVTRAGGTMQGVVLGTVGYMAPEQVRAQHTDQRTDIFALGVVMHEMLTGRPPFAEPSAIETMTAIATKDPPELTRSGSGTPAPLVRIVRRCLEKRPGDRFQSARDLAFALENLTDATPALPASERRVTSRSLARVSGLILALAVAAAVGAFSVGRVSRLPEPSFRRLTSQRGIVRAARFGPDDHTIWYSAAWNGGPSRVFVTRVDTRESSPLDVPPGDLVAITSTGEIVLLAGRGATGSVVFGGTGTLARVSIMGGATRELIEQVEDADVSADASTFAIVRTTGGRYRLEYPPGKVLYETNGYISSPRLSPRGDRIAFLDHPVTGDDRGVVAVVDLTGKRTVLTPEWIGEQGLAWTPNGREIWFAAGPGDEPRAIYAVTLGGQVRLVYRAPMHLKLEDVGPDGRVLLSGEDFRNDVIAVSAEDGRERDLSWFHLQATRGLSSDGRMLVFSWLSGFDYASSTCARPTVLRRCASAWGTHRISRQTAGG